MMTRTFFRGGLDGTVDSNGLCILAGDPDPEPGFSLSLLDANGNPLPSTRWSIEVATAPPGGGGVATAQAIKYVEPRWNFLTKFAVAYQQIFNNNTLGYIAAKAMMDDVWEICNARNQPGVVNGQTQRPFELIDSAAWTQLGVHLADTIVRNFFYFGHGGTDLIGIKKVPTLQITISDLNNIILKNGSAPFDGLNRHAYRFVFIDGCDTAKGDLCRAFGIDKEENTPLRRFTDQGMRVRAFMGWKKHAIIGFTKSYFEVKHQGFIPAFFDKWADPSRSPPRTLREAITEAGVLSDGVTPWSEIPNLKVYGYEGLLWQDTIP